MNPLDTELARLTITAYSDRKMTDLVGSIEATCNPETVDLGYQIEYKAEDFINQVEAVSEYQRAKPGDLKLELIFDAKLPDDTEPVQQQIDRLIQLCCAHSELGGEPNFLKVTWGKLKWGASNDYRGRVSSMNISYTLFKNSGKPLRAKASLTLVATESLTFDRKAILDKPIPNVTIAPDLADLAWIAAKSAAVVTSKYAGRGNNKNAEPARNNYVELANNNDCDNLDDFRPGDTLVHIDEGTL